MAARGIERRSDDDEFDIESMSSMVAVEEGKKEDDDRLGEIRTSRKLQGVHLQLITRPRKQLCVRTRGSGGLSGGSQAHRPVTL